VVTVLGHVDHGKTSLLDRIRKADVAAHEAGGITQHVGAYRVSITGSDGAAKTVVFLDTPGHQAFTSMRARGAGLTDLVCLVVAADDGVMPQTVESINHAKAAQVPIVVVLNKIDKPEATEANVRKIYGQLAEQGLNPTEWGGTTEVMRVSATRGDGVKELLEVLDYQAALLELKADYGGAARGTVIESQMLIGRGPVARVMVQQGMLRVGDFIVIGRAFGRVRDMTDDRGQEITQAGPATPVELSGIDEIPDAGDKFYSTDTLQKAEQIATAYREKERLKQLATQTKVTLENFATQADAGHVKELRVVLKADVQGSIDVLKKSLTDQSTAEVAVKVLHAAVGGITETDVLLADASDAVVIGFHVVAPAMVRDLAEQRHVEVRLYRIIYEVTDELRKAMEGLLEPETKEEQLGSAEVREVFHITKVGAVAGCMVTEGQISRTAKVRVVRDNVVVTDNRNIESLRRLKEDAKEVRSGFECGIRLAGFDDIKPGDKIVAFNTITVKRKLAP
jgi:translation initiation factor IF-2